MVIIDIVLIREYLAHELKTKRIQESAQNIDQFCDRILMTNKKMNLLLGIYIFLNWCAAVKQYCDSIEKSLYRRQTIYNAKIIEK